MDQRADRLIRRIAHERRGGHRGGMGRGVVEQRPRHELQTLRSAEQAPGVGRGDPVADRVLSGPCRKADGQTRKHRGVTEQLTGRQ
jgi:hypothetical protein